MNRRYNIVKGMHEIICAMNNEDAYFRWIYIVPDCATDEDLQEIAASDTLFADTVAAFKRIYTAYADDGLFVDRKLW